MKGQPANSTIPDDNDGLMCGSASLLHKNLNVFHINVDVDLVVAVSNPDVFEVFLRRRRNPNKGARIPMGSPAAPTVTIHNSTGALINPHPIFGAIFLAYGDRSFHVAIDHMPAFDLRNQRQLAIIAAPGVDKNRFSVEYA